MVKYCVHDVILQGAGASASKTDANGANVLSRISLKANANISALLDTPVLIGVIASNKIIESDIGVAASKFDSEANKLVACFLFFEGGGGWQGTLV